MQIHNSVPAYISTRGEAPSFTFQQALLEGLAKDGGLFSPTHIVEVNSTDWREAKYFPALAAAILQKWIGDDIPSTELNTIVDDALSFPSFLGAP